jgi:hypothetical protein
MALAGAVSGNFLGAGMTNQPGITHGVSELFACTGAGLGFAKLHGSGKNPAWLAACRLLRVVAPAKNVEPGCRRRAAAGHSG